MNGLFPDELLDQFAGSNVDEGGGGAPDYDPDSHSYEDDDGSQSDDDETIGNLLGPHLRQLKPIRFPPKSQSPYFVAPVNSKPLNTAPLAEQEEWHNHHQFQLQREDMFRLRDSRGIVKYQDMPSMPVVQHVHKRSEFPRRAKWYWYFLFPYYCGLHGDDFHQIVKYILSQTKWGKLFLVVIIHIIKLQKIYQLKKTDGNFLFFIFFIFKIQF